MDHVGAITGAASCEVEHLGLVVSVRAMRSMDEGFLATSGYAATHD